jgi:ATP-dependent DNA ligase
MDETLYKVNYLDAPNGKVQTYRIYTTQVGNEWDLDAQAGQEGGNLRTTNHNPKGGRYATLGDAEAKANSKIKEKTDRGYQSTKLGAQNDPIFLPMLALGTKNTDGSLKMEVFNNLDFPVIVQRKFDGLRGIATVNANGSIKFVSRKNNEYTIPIKHIRQEIASMTNLPDDIILDGELYAEPADLDFNVANGLIRTSAKSMNPKKEAQQKLLKYRVYDFFDPNNRDLTYTERHAMLDKWITPQMKSLVLTKNHIVNDSQEIVDLSERFVRERYEGGIVRIPSAPYGVDMRNKNLMLKVKFFIDEEFEIVDYTDGDTSSSEGLVKWIVMTPDGDTFKVSMNAPHDEQRRLFQEGDKYIGSDLTVEFERYSKDGIPMKPRGKAIRNYE